ncbi:MAG: dTDP-4-dehydrorhamnose 3,5-epimerase [Pseudomonadota bacterium]
MRVEPLSIPDVKLLFPTRLADERGYFSETYNRQAFENAGIDAQFCQDNHSLSVVNWTLRGLHYQAPPFAQAKLVRVVSGAILDVAVDARRGSPDFGRWVSARLSSELGNQLYVPSGFLHGFLTLEPHTEVSYKVSAHYDSDSDGAVLWNDADLAIEWGVSDPDVTLSKKDAAAPVWSDFESPFTYT